MRTKVIKKDRRVSAGQRSLHYNFNFNYKLNFKLHVNGDMKF